MSQRVIVVGSGLAGLSAACELLEKGCNVTIVEKEQNLGGNSTKATTGIAAPDSSIQKANNIKDDCSDLTTEGPEAKAFIAQGTKDLEWLTKFLGVESELVLRVTPGHKVARTVATSKNFPGAVVTYAAIHVLGQIATAKPDRLEMAVNTRVTKLLQTAGKVTGVEVEGPDGMKKTMEGAVILATGGYCGDFSPQSILSKYAKAYTQYPTTNDERTNGDGIRLASSAGGAASNLDKIQLTPTAANIPGQAGANFKLVLSDAIIGAGAKLVDATGRRFCNEMSTSAERVNAMKDARPPFRLVITADQAVSVDWLVQFYHSRKVMSKFNSSRDLAGSMGVNPAALQDIPPNVVVYMAIVTPALYTCGGGVQTGWQAAAAGKVLAANGQPVVGLYAAGETSSVSFPRLWSISGVPLLHAIYSGRMAGRAAASAVPGQSRAMDLRDIIISSISAQNKAAEEDSKPAGEEKKEETGKPLEELTKEELISKIKDMEANPPTNGAAAESEEDKGITLAEVGKHKTKEDAWIVVNGEVWDVTNWIAIHPGGEQAIVSYLGQDASDEWNAIHKPNTMEKNKVEKGGKGPWPVGKVGSGSSGGAAKSGGGDGGLTMEEVGKHNQESDVWVVVSGKAYDVTKWAQVHPGGVPAIMAYAGKDATDEWNCIHKPGTIEKNLFPANPNGAVDKGAVSGAAVAAPTGPVDDTPPPPDGDGGIPGIIGGILFLIKNIILMLVRTVFLTGNFKIDGERTGTIRSACFLLTFTIVHVMGNFVGMLKGPQEANGEGYFFDRLAWTGGFGIAKEGPLGLSAVELYLAFALFLHVSVALKRSWDISMNYCLHTGRWNMLFSGLTILFFLTMHLADLRFSSKMTFTKLRPPKYYVAFSGLLEGRVFYETDPSIPEVRVRNLYGREVELFKDMGVSVLYTTCIVVFWAHMLIGWKKLVPSDAMQIPKDHVQKVVVMGWVAATAIASMYVSVVWYTYFAPEQYVPLVD